ncbi:MAG: DNA helicase UvrD [Nanoarchaeota archaeon]|nr:DNA helicase UvrD [Nanoarchaeota archaeon]
MEFISDLHLHSKYSRACSKDLDIKNMEKYARLKGVNLMGTGDFQHPKWNKEIKEDLSEDGSGILKTKTGFPFILSTEISLIYSQGGKGRKVHNVVLVKDFESADNIQAALLKKGRIDYDGRPIFGMSCPDFVDLVKDVGEDTEVIPAHVWTPWFGLFGSNGGFDSVEEAFDDRAKDIHALETGLSSDPEMNWRLSKLDRYSLISNSDSHSYWPWRMGREATVFDLKELTFDNVLKALRTKQGLKETIEVDPGYGKYHYDGHRNCKLSMSPEEANMHNKICPRCNRPLTIGVENRVNELADRKLGFVPKDAVPFKKYIPLSEIISAAKGKAVATKSVWEEYYKLVGKLGSEYDVLRVAEKKDIAELSSEKLADYIIKSREQKIRVIPGFDGVYGIPVFDEDNVPVLDYDTTDSKDKQKGLSEWL